MRKETRKKLEEWAKSDEQFPGWYNEAEGGDPNGSDFLFWAILVIFFGIVVGVYLWH